MVARDLVARVRGAADAVAGVVACSSVWSGEAVLRVADRRLGLGSVSLVDLGEVGGDTDVLSWLALGDAAVLSARKSIKV